MKAGESEKSDKEGWAGDRAWRKLQGSRAVLGRSFQTLSVLVCVIRRATEKPPEASFQELIVEGVRMS